MIDNDGQHRRIQSQPSREEQAIDDATQAYFANMINQQTVTTTKIATLMETNKQLLDQVK